MAQKCTCVVMVHSYSKLLFSGFMLFVSTELYLGMLIIIVWNWNDSVKCLTIGCIASVSFLAGTRFFFLFQCHSCIVVEQLACHLGKTMTY